MRLLKNINIFELLSKAMSKEITLEDYKRAYREMEKEEARRGFIAHLVIYILVNIMLIAINLIYVPGELWFFYPLIGWGIGVAMHYLFGVRWLENTLIEKEAKAEYRAREGK
jgi:fatty acid desaturase